MSFKANLRPLPTADRRESLGEFLALLNRDPELAHLRSILRTGQERQLALFAALERDVVQGSPSACPPAPDDQPDLLLCDILDAIDRDPDLKQYGSPYGVDRHLANLQAFGLWRKREPISRPTALELFTTTYAALTAGATSTLPSPASNNSPLPQGSGPDGEELTATAIEPAASFETISSPQVTTATLVVAGDSPRSSAAGAARSVGIIHQPADPCGEEFATATADTHQVPIRPVRRGRPIALDDLAKGKLLGLMSYGLSFRQAAAQLGVHHVTILNTMKRDEEFAQQVAEARLDAISQPLLTVIQASRKNWRAAAWLAKFLNDRRASRYETTPEESELARARG